MRVTINTQKEEDNLYKNKVVHITDLQLNIKYIEFQMNFITKNIREKS